MKAKYGFILILLIAFVIIFMITKSQGENCDNLSSFKTNKTIYTYLWSPRGEVDINCIISVITPKPDMPKERVLNMSICVNSKKSTLFELRESGPFISMFPLDEEAEELFAIWSGVSGYHFYIFEYEKGKVNTTLNAGSRYFPEITYDINHKPIILITDANTKPRKTAFYKMVNGKYIITKSVNYENRFKGL